MNRKRMFLRLVMKDAFVRKDRALTALLSVAVVATMATVALTIYYDLEGRLSREFRSSGANVVVSKHDGSFSAAELAKIGAAVGSQGEVVPVAYAIGTMSDGKKIVVGGVDIGKLSKLNSWWSLTPRDKGLALIGARANEDVPAGPVTLSFAHGSDAISLGTVFRSGSDDDSRIYLPLSQFTTLTGLEANTVLVRFDGRPQQIQSGIDELSASLPHQIEVEPVRQITQTQTAVLGKTRSVVLAASGVVVILIMLCMVATFSSSVLERRRDYAVMKALGASNRAVNVLFSSQSVFLSLAGVLIGFVAGSGVAYWIGKVNFGAALFPHAVLLFPVVLGSILLALIASTAPIRLLQRIQPAGILRGE